MASKNEFSDVLKKSLDHPFLSDQETRDYLIRAKEGDEEAIVMLLRHNERLVFKVCQRYYISGATGDSTLDDLMQEGRMGLLKAITKFDLKRTYKGKLVKFSTYAVWWIRQYVFRNGIRNGMTIAISHTGIEKRGRAIRSRAALTEKLERAPTKDEISAHAKITDNISSTLDFQFVKLEDNLLEDPDISGVVENKMLSNAVLKAIQNLPGVQQEVLTRSLLQDQSIQEISKAIGKSPTNTAKIKRNAIQKIRLTLSVLKS